MYFYLVQWMGYGIGGHFSYEKGGKGGGGIRSFSMTYDSAI